MSDAPARPSNLNLPNALTTLRIVMVPFFGWALLHDGGESTTWRWVAYALFVIAMITDKVDGDIARKHNLITNFGKIADPIADKAMTGMAFIGLSIVGDVGQIVPGRMVGATVVESAGADLVARVTSGTGDAR